MKRSTEPKPAPQAHTESRDGHTWHVTSWGYATRNCSFGLQCECRQPAATPAEPTPTTAARPPRTRRTATPAENEERQFAREFLSDLEEKPPRTRRAAKAYKPTLAQLTQQASDELQRQAEHRSEAEA